MLLDRLAALLERPLAVDAAPVVVEARDAIVVLGATLGRRDTLTPILAERIAAAADLWRAGGGRVVIVTGGVTHRARRAEADVMADALAALGVPDVVVERDAQTTLDNARMSAPLLAARGARTVWLVTQPFHARRSVRLFRRAGFDARAWPIPDSIQYRDRPRAMRWIVREYGAWLRLYLREQVTRFRGIA